MKDDSGGTSPVEHLADLALSEAHGRRHPCLVDSPLPKDPVGRLSPETPDPGTVGLMRALFRAERLDRKAGAS